jgi:hypothetical protein
MVGNVHKVAASPLIGGVRRIGRIAERRHTAIAIYINGVGYLKALHAEEKRFALSGDGLFKNRGCHNF